MKWTEIIKILTIVYDIIKALVKVYQELEEKYKWGSKQGPDVKAAVRDKKRSEFDTATVKLFEAKGLPKPERETQAYIRELVHSKVGVKPRINGRKPT